MTIPSAGTWLWPLACTLLLGACRGVEVRDAGPGMDVAFQQRVAEVSAFEQWGFSGRLSLDDGEEGGSGTLRWSAEGAITQLDFRGAMGRGAWQLHIAPQAATLMEADGSMQTAPDVGTLLRDRIGWHIPVDALAWWVRGLEAPGAPVVRELGAGGRLVMLEQFGWVIEFGRYQSANGLLLPARLEARRGDYRIKLAVGRWSLGSP